MMIPTRLAPHDDHPSYDTLAQIPPDAPTGLLSTFPLHHSHRMFANSYQLIPMARIR